MNHDVTYFPSARHFSDGKHVCPMDPSVPSESRFVHRTQIAGIGHICTPSFRTQNGLAEGVLDKKIAVLIVPLIVSFLHLIHTCFETKRKAYRDHLKLNDIEDGKTLDKTITFLTHTSMMVELFSDHHLKDNRGSNFLEIGNKMLLRQRN